MRRRLNLTGMSLTVIFIAIIGSVLSLAFFTSVQQPVTISTEAAAETMVK